MPSTGCSTYTAVHGEEEKAALYPHNSSWLSVTARTDYENRYPYMSARIIDNLLKPGAKVSVANWDTVTASPELFKLMIDLTYNDRAGCDYDLSTPMRRSNS